MRSMGHQDDHAEEAEEARRGAADGAGGPLALGLRAQVRPCFLEGDFDVLPEEVRGQDGQRIDVLVSAGERVGREPAVWVTHQNPADGQRVQPSVCQSAVPVATSSRRCWCPYQTWMRRSTAAMPVRRLNGPVFDA